MLLLNMQLILQLRLKHCTGESFQSEKNLPDNNRVQTLLHLNMSHISPATMLICEVSKSNFLFTPQMQSELDTTLGVLYLLVSSNRSNNTNSTDGNGSSVE